MSFQSLLNSAADLKRPVPDYDDMGSVTYTLTTYMLSMPCRISQGVPSEISSGPTEYSEATAMIYIYPGLTSVQVDDEVHHGSDTYEVLGVKTPSVSEHHTTLICKVRTDGS